MSPSGDGAINGGCCCSCSPAENGGYDGATNFGISASHDETCMHCPRSEPSSCSSSELGFDSVLLTESERLRRIFVASAKGFSIGAGLQGGLAIFSILARLRRKKPKKVEAFSDKEAISMAIKETLRYDCLPPSYKSFLNQHGGKDIVILQGVKELASGLPFTTLEAIEKIYKATGVDVKLDPNMKIPCSMVHGNKSCRAHAITFLIEAYKRALPVYLPVYLIPALIVHHQGLFKRMWTCMLFGFLRRCSIPLIAIGSFPAGLSVAIEKKSRRMEISLYCLARAIESFFTWMADIGYLPRSKNLNRPDVMIFSLSTAIIMHCYAQERELFNSKYLNVLDWIFGVPPPPCENPSLQKQKSSLR
ncbi:Transmembrane protein [Gossypium australe]|uniref:Transmembrane protein n=1 Tax=Gossypium australe TaxID=47621 RepID=A0A5B6U6Y3_9ROSI|nr:Transmembrane protein [Gossypium australe]